MSTIGHIAWKELRTYFTSWIAYVVCAGWALMTGIIFYILLAQAMLGNFDVTPLYGTLVIVMLFMVPMVTMRLLAEERSSATLEMLFTSPLTEWQVTLGKWLAAFGFCAVLLLLTAHVPVVAFKYGTFDHGPILGAYIALLCLSAAFCAFGVFCSSLTDSQIVAGFMTFGGLLLSWMLAWVTSAAPDNPVTAVISRFSISSHFESMMRGAVDTTDLVYFALVTIFFLYATTRVLESRKWR